MRGPGSSISVAVDARKVLTPRDAERIFSGLARSYRAIASNIPILVVAPWLSSRTREILNSDGINYLDLTGNAWISIDHPSNIFISSQGDDRNRAPSPRGKARVRGPKAGRLIRFLLDVKPPYSVSHIAAATGLAPGYVSRLLDTLDNEALIDRVRRGEVVSVDVAGLVYRWAEDYDILGSNKARSFVASQGPRSLLEQLTTISASVQLAVTGSFAAVRLAPIAAPTLLALYCSDIAGIAERTKLIPSERGANVVLLGPFDPVVWARTTTEGGITYAAVSQVVVDCLTGNGRMPAEGEAVLAWMQSNESSWRISSIGELQIAS